MTTQTTAGLAYRISRAAQMLDASRSTIYRLVRAKQLTLIKVGPHASRITAASLEAFMRAREAARSG